MDNFYTYKTYVYIKHNLGIKKVELFIKKLKVIAKSKYIFCTLKKKLTSFYTVLLLCVIFQRGFLFKKTEIFFKLIIFKFYSYQNIKT